MFPTTHDGHFAREAEYLAAAIVLNIWEGRHEAHQKHEGHNRKFTRLSASFEILPPVAPSPSILSNVFLLRMVFSLSINIWRFMMIKKPVHVIPYKQKHFLFLLTPDSNIQIFSWSIYCSNRG
jgi:hypothetical protein